MIKKNKNGCVVQYSNSPLKLPNDDMVYFKIERIEIPEGCEEDMVSLLKEVENDINTETIRITNGRAIGVFPHFYIECPYLGCMDLILSIFAMTYVDELKIMVQPAIDDLNFKGSCEEYLEMKKAKKEFVLVANARDTEAEKSMIQYWVDKTHYEFGYAPFTCPATYDTLNRDMLDGAHVEIVGHSEMGQFITPVSQTFNRSHSRRSFYVKPENLVIAPK